MNKLFTIAISAYLILWIMSSCATKRLTKDSLIKDSGSGRMVDSGEPEIPVKIESFPLEIIPPSSGVQFYREGIVFLSESKNEEEAVSGGHLSFGTAQAYYASFEDTTLGQHINFSPKTPFPYPCDAISFSDNFGTMYFTKKSGKNSLEKIFRAEVFRFGDNNQVWTFDTDPLEFCKGESIYSHPAVSVDGSMMIFSSNNPESAGGMDLFITRNENMRWSEPENLGKIINTAGNEIFPVLDRNNNLYFSSNKLPGYGGYDIFICKYFGKGWNSPIRMTKYINTKNDEFAFTIDRISGRSAFFTSKLISKSAKTQLYRINLNEELPVNDNKDLSAYLYAMSVAGIDTSEIRIAYKLADPESIKAAKARADSIETAKFNAQRLEAERLQAAKIKADSLEAQRIAADKFKAERIAAEKLKTARLEEERIAAEKLKAARLEEERVAAEKLKADRLEEERIAAEKLKAARLEEERVAAEKLKAARLEEERIAAEKLKAARLEEERVAAEKLKAARLEEERIAAEKLKTDRLEEERIAAEKLKARNLEAERIKAEKIKADSIAAKRNAERLEAEKIRAANKLRADSIEAARLEALKKESKDLITYSVQILSTIKPEANFEVTVNGVKYSTRRYLYLGEYRYIIGEFNTLDPARELQNDFRKSVHPRAFVVAFKNGIRSLDPELFR